MQIFLQHSNNLAIIEDYLVFNYLPHKKIDLWNQDIDIGGRYAVNADDLLNNSALLIIPHKIFIELLTNESSKKELVDFCNNNNYVWVWQDIDAICSTINYCSELEEFDRCIKNNSITIFVDGRLCLNNYVNLNYCEFKYNYFMNMPRITNAQVEKNTNAKDFLLISKRKKNRPHRDLLWHELNKTPALIQQNNVNSIECEFANNKSYYQNQFKGQKPYGDNWIDGYPYMDLLSYPSMDLYRDSFFEIVPETLCDGAYYYTEKSNKPIATKTPFIIVSTQGYLKYLHTFGFKTFSSLINENYDQEYNLETRIKMVVELLIDIIHNGSSDFYHASKEILDHNHRILAELSGMNRFESDCLITQNLEKIKYG